MEGRFLRYRERNTWNSNGLWIVKNREGWMDEVNRRKAEVPRRCGPGAMLM